jgi:splicing factor 3A subunit 3
MLPQVLILFCTFSLRAQELLKVSAPATAPGQDDLEEFYTRFNKIKDHHSQHPDLDLDLRGFLSELKQLVDGDGLQRIQVEGEEEEVVDCEHRPRRRILCLLADRKVSLKALDAMFSGEEGMGRFLDLYISHAQYINLRGAKRLVE